MTSFFDASSHLKTIPLRLAGKMHLVHWHQLYIYIYIYLISKLNHDSNIKFPSVLLHIFFLNVSLILLQVTTTTTKHTTLLGLSKYKKV